MQELKRSKNIVTGCMAGTIGAVDRPRHDKLIFCGFAVPERNTWEQSEAHGGDVFNNNLSLSLAPDSTTPAQRLGRFGSTENRPIIVKLIPT